MLTLPKSKGNHLQRIMAQHTSTASVVLRNKDHRLDEQ